MKTRFSIPKRLDNKIRYLSRYADAVRSKLGPVVIGEIFCQAIADEVWQSSVEIAHEIGAHEPAVQDAIDTYRSAGGCPASGLDARVVQYKARRDSLSLVALGSELLRAQSLGYAASVPAIAKKVGLSVEDAKFAAAFASLPAHVMGCALIVGDIRPSDLRRIGSLAERDGWEALDARAKTFVMQQAARRLSKAGIFRLLGTGRF
ncbi:hypothetical protein SB384_34605 [Burkholderia cenocepacia]|uniref:hypothetical protein n=1 Tax=Burkholderia cepacia complex TaxID=87882 RepID=UPI001CF42A09|nr:MULTISPECIES: hypothetical protein [Burkholderia cepacia complex]MCA7889418.1 hypothetical protein [Burkholderia contaminans]MEB2604784.1 hypothetical protein [Burkholderia cenocepacia]